MSISIVIPNYNGEDLLKINLPKVYKASKSVKYNTEILVVDDASTDKSISILRGLKSEIPNLKIFENSKNLGFSSTANKGVEQAKGEIIILLNTDVYPEVNFIEPLIEDFKDSEVFGIGFLDKSLENEHLVSRGRGIGKWRQGFLSHQKGEIDKNNTLWASGGSSAFRKTIWKKLGGLNTIYNPFYWEDIDLSYRGLKSGYQILFEKRSIVYHNHEKGSIKKHYSNFDIKRIAYRNQFIFVWENATDISLQFIHIIFLPYHLFRALKALDWAFWLGFIDAFVLLPKIIKSSFKAQKQFIKTDKEVIKEFSI